MTDETQGAAAAAADDTTLVPEVEGDGLTTEADAPSGDDAAAPAQAEAPKPKQTAQQRIDEMTWKLREAERRESALLDRIGRAPQAEAAKPAPAPDAPAKPDPSAYEDGAFDARYVEDLTSWKAEQIINARLAQSEAQTQARSVRQRFEAKAAEVAAKTPDFHEVVGADYSKVGPLLTEPMQLAVSESELGPELAYHLGKNPAEARRIAALSPIAQVREIGRLEARLETPAAPKANTITNAPAPTPQVRGAGGQFKAAPDTNDFEAFQKAYP